VCGRRFRPRSAIPPCSRFIVVVAEAAFAPTVLGSPPHTSPINNNPVRPSGQPEHRRTPVTHHDHGQWRNGCSQERPPEFRPFTNNNTQTPCRGLGSREFVYPVPYVAQIEHETLYMTTLARFVRPSKRSDVYNDYERIRINIYPQISEKIQKLVAKRRTITEEKNCRTTSTVTL